LKVVFLFPHRLIKALLSGLHVELALDGVELFLGVIARRE